MGTARHRDLPDVTWASYGGGYVWKSKTGSVLGTGTSSGLQSDGFMNDTIGDPPPPPDHPMNSSRYIDEVDGVTGFTVGPAPNLYRVEFNNYHVSGSTSKSHISHGLTANSTDYAAIAARTNPSRPGITPLTLLQDVKDLPRMIRDTGRLLRKPRKLMSAKELANANLMAQFGWLPLIRDVQDLMDLGSKIDKRHKELSKLYDRGWIGRTIELDKAHRVGQSSTDITIGPSGSGRLSPSHKWVKTTDARKWGSSRWKLSYRPPHKPTDAQTLAMARRLTYGLTVEGLAKGAWDVLPWTWLLDWFTNTGDFLVSHSNTIPATLSSCCVMLEVNSTIVYTRTDPYTDVQGGEGTAKYSTKLRNVGHPTLLNASFPNISVNDLSILGSLFAQRLK